MAEKRRKRPKGTPGVYVDRPRPNRLKEIREGGVVLSQPEVARLLGVNNTTVSKHESGDRKLTRGQMLAYAQIYKCDTVALFIKPEQILDENAATQP